MKKNNFNKNIYKIFLFHGVIKKNYDIRNYTKKHILEKKFIKKIKFLKKKYNILSLNQILYLIKNNKHFPSNTCAITFDDGFNKKFTKRIKIINGYYYF